MSSLKKFFGDTIIYGIGSVIPRVINFLLVIVTTSALDTTSFSAQTKWYIYAAFINVILALGLETTFFRFYTKKENKEKVISTSFFILTMSTLVFLILSLLFQNSLIDFLELKENIYFYILIGVTALDAIMVIPYALLRVQGKAIKFVLVKMIYIIIYSCIVICALKIIPNLPADVAQRMQLQNFKPDILHLYIASIVASFACFIALIPNISHIKFTRDLELSKEMLQYGIPIMIGGVAYIINEQSDRLIIPKLISESTNGIYAACYKLSVFMTLYITAFRMGAEPYFFNQSAMVDAKTKYSLIMRWFVVIGCGFVIFITVFIDLFAYLFLKQEIYKTGIYIVPILLLAHLCFGIYSNLSIWYKLTDKTRFGMYISILGAFLTLISLFTLVPILGIVGGAIATLITYGFMMFISWYWGQKYYPISYDVMYILMTMGFTAILVILSFMLYRENYLASVLILMLYILYTYMTNKDFIKKTLMKN